MRRSRWSKSALSDRLLDRKRRHACWITKADSLTAEEIPTPGAADVGSCRRLPLLVFADASAAAVADTAAAVAGIAGGARTDGSLGRDVGANCTGASEDGSLGRASGTPAAVLRWSALVARRGE